MTQLYASIAVGTAATLLATILLLLRAKYYGGRPVVTLARRWIATSSRTSGLVVALLSAIAGFSFASIPANEGANSSSASAPSDLTGAPSTQGKAPSSDEDPQHAQALESLRAYADKIDAKPQSTAANPSAPESGELPDVETMIAKLVARLGQQPDDAKGWKMLGWSYLNTNRPEEAARAYETALKLEPGDIEARKALEGAKAAETSASQTSLPDPATSQTAQDIKGGEDRSRPEMIRGMVEQLATRLETSPNDEDGWLFLMRSRMTLGEKDAAKAALIKALEAFASDAAAKARLTGAARDLGVEIN